VAANPIPLGSIFIQLMKEAVKDKSWSSTNLIGESLFIKEESNIRNIRNIQPLKERPVFYFDHDKYCWPYKRKPCIPKVKKEETIEQQIEERYGSKIIKNQEYFTSIYQTITFPYERNEIIVLSNENNIK
jgi:hypothetical protein